eukprot:TRINITY_DN42_c0_g3_i2.p1 TRINITY_DN42_c0_g3~~TRINITY_DN42_c0_g3_i2.p1  ORF type:complete len:181 (-),score=42.79 TRINITY_DN42_c0_g3_i2:1236-1778(-)
MKCAAAITVLATGVSAFAPPSGLAAPRASSSLKMAAATKSDLPVNLINPDFFWGEEGYRTYVATYKGDALVNRVYPVLDRVREKKLLTKTAELGLLGALEDAGLTLSQAEALLPAVEEAGLLSFAANNADFLLNTAAFLVSVAAVSWHALAVRAHFCEGWKVHVGMACKQGELHVNGSHS